MPACLPTQKATPTSASAQPAATSATRPAVDAPANEYVGSSRPTASETAPTTTLSPRAPIATGTRRTCQLSHARARGPIGACPDRSRLGLRLRDDAEMRRTVEVPDYEVHTRVPVDPARTALLVIDMQN